MLTRLHRTYAHPGAARLLYLPKEAGCTDAAIAPALRRVSEVCAVCQESLSCPLRAVVTMPRVIVFNDTVVVDLAEIAGRGRFLRVVDMGTCLSRCVFVADKEAPTIVHALPSVRICTYETMRWLLSDPRQEFHNALVRALGDRFNIAVNVTAGQSACINGICERHHRVFRHMVLCFAADCPAASFQELLDPC